MILNKVNLNMTFCKKFLPLLWKDYLNIGNILDCNYLYFNEYYAMSNIQKA